MSAVTFILSLARKLLAKESKGITTIPNRMAVEQKAGEIAATLQNAGLPLNRADEFIKSEQDLTRILNMIESTPPVMKEVPSGIRSTKSAKVFDLEGKEIKNPKNIMGGKEVKETEAQIKTRLEKGNKEAAKNLRMKKIVDDAIDNMSPSLSGDTRTDAALVAEDMAESMGKVYDDLSQMERLDLYDQAYTGLSKIRFKGFKKPKDSDPEDMAQGGRAGFKSGSFLFKGAKKLGKKYKGSTLEALLENPKLLGTELSYEGIMELLRMGGMMQNGGRAGFFLGSANPRGLGLLRTILKYMSKTGQELDKFQGVDLSALDMLRFSNPKRFNKLLEDVRGKVNVKEGIMGTDSVRAMQQADREKRKGITAGALQVAKDMKARDDAIRRRVAEEAEYTIIPKMKKQLMEGMGMSEEAAEKTARDMAEAAQNIRLTDDPPIITKEGILELENVLKNMETGGKRARELNADGGRIGFKDGMTRRTFLKLLGGLASIPIVGKIVKPIKLVTGVKKVPIIKTDDVPGKPEWFDQLVNKVIIEGDDVTKKFATGERQSIHQKTLDDGSVVRVTEDVDDGAVRVEYESEQNVFGDPVQMEYKKPLPDEGAPSPTAEFTTAESGPVGRSMGPDDYEIDVDEVGGTSIRDLDSDVSKLKQYATGKGPTMKEIVEIKKRKDKAKAISEDMEAQSDAVIRRQGDADSSYYGDDYARGGIARMLGE